MFLPWMILAAAAGYACLSKETQKRLRKETKKAIKDMREARKNKRTA